MCCIAQAKVLTEVARVFVGARLVALTKTDGGIRGIATGSSLRWVKQFSKVFEAECAPF